MPLKAGGGGGAGGTTFQVENTNQVSGWDVPELTAEQVTAIYNCLVTGGSVTIQSEDGDVQFKVVLGDTSTGRPAVLLQYYWLGWVDYQIAVDEETVAITAYKIPDISGLASKAYVDAETARATAAEQTLDGKISQHQITSVTVGTDTIDVVIS